MPTGTRSTTRKIAADATYAMRDASDVPVILVTEISREKSRSASRAASGKLDEVSWQKVSGTRRCDTPQSLREIIVTSANDHAFYRKSAPAPRDFTCPSDGCVVGRNDGRKIGV